MSAIEDVKRSVGGVIEKVSMTAEVTSGGVAPRAVFAPYTFRMADTTIKVDSQVRDRLATLAAEHGTTTRDFVARLAAAAPTQAELQQRQAQAIEYIRSHLRPDFGPDDIAAGHHIWDDLPVARPAQSPAHDEGRRADGDGGQAA